MGTDLVDEPAETIQPIRPEAAGRNVGLRHNQYGLRAASEDFKRGAAYFLSRVFADVTSFLNWRAACCN